jgi:hypothetical protein
VAGNWHARLSPVGTEALVFFAAGIGVQCHEEESLFAYSVAERREKGFIFVNDKLFQNI